MVTDKRKEQIQSELDEQRKAIEAKRNQLEDCSRRFDRAYDDMRQLLIHSPSGGYERYLDELEQARSKLKFEMDQYGTCSNELAKLTRTFDHLANQDRDNTKENMAYADDQTNIVNDVKKKLDKTEDFIYYEVNRHINHIGELVEASRHIA
jgi:chromosome segregation ATPase